MCYNTVAMEDSSGRDFSVCYIVALCSAVNIIPRLIPRSEQSSMRGKVCKFLYAFIISIMLQLGGAFWRSFSYTSGDKILLTSPDR